MAKGIIISGGNGGDGSDDCTATTSQVLEGYKAITSDSDDEVANGTMQDLSTRATITHSSSNSTKVIIGDAAFVSTNNDGTTRAEIRYNGNEGLIRGNTLFGISQSTMATAGSLTAAKLLAGQSAFGISGTATSDATATDGYVYSGKTYYRNGVKGTGSMTVSSVVSFSVAAYSTSQVLCTWKNPAKGPYGGVIIRYKTGSYPSSVTDGTLCYQGVGTNYALSGTSTTYINGLTAGTTYYFSIWMYCITSVGTLYSSSYKTASAAPTSKGMQTFKSSGTFTVPSNVRSIDIFVCGAGGGGHSSTGTGKYANYYASGGGGGYTTTKKAYTVTPGQTFAVVVGVCSSTISAGGSSSFGSLLTAAGGESGRTHSNHRSSNGVNGGSGASACYYYANYTTPGTDGGDAGDAPTYTADESKYTPIGGKGQGSTTRAFAESGNTLYSNGGHMNWGAAAPAENTGHGGFGIDGKNNATIGGSGVVIVRWGY